MAPRMEQSSAEYLSLSTGAFLFSHYPAFGLSKQALPDSGAA
jgi:hypothetical protein